MRRVIDAISRFERNFPPVYLLCRRLKAIAQATTGVGIFFITATNSFSAFASIKFDRSSILATS